MRILPLYFKYFAEYSKMHLMQPGIMYHKFYDNNVKISYTIAREFRKKVFITHIFP